MRSLIKNWAFLLTSNVGQSVFGFFVFIILARVLSPEGYGAFSALLALTSLVTVFVNNLSTNLVITREITLHPDATAGILKFVYPIRLFSFIIGASALVIYLINYEAYSTSLIIGSVVIVGSIVLWDMIESIVFGHFVTKYTTVISLAASLVWLGLMLIIPHKYLNVTMVLWIYALIMMIRASIYFVVGYKKYIKNNTTTPKIGFRNILLMSGPYLWMRLIATFTDQIPILMLNQQLGSIEVGYFSVGNRLIMPITLTVTTALRAAFPFMTKLYHDDSEKFNSGTVRGFSYVLILASIIAALLSITSELWIPVIFGVAYQNSIAVFNFQAWFGALLCFDLMLSTILSSTYRQRVLAIVTTIDVLIVFPLIWWGVKHGAEGVAIAKLSGVLVTTLFHIFVIAKTLQVPLLSPKFISSVVFFLAMLVISLVNISLYSKIMLVSLLIIMFIIPRNSPLKEIYTMILKIIKTKIVK
jgi:O-antigen/teichoic acid export membrane protein